MKTMSRRAFIKQSAVAGGVLLASPLLGTSVAGLSKPDGTGHFERGFGVDHPMCAKLLKTALSRGGDFADLYFEHTISNWLMLEDGIVNQSYGIITLGVGIRTVNGDQVGYGYTEDLSLSAMMDAARTAASLTDKRATAIAPAFSAVDCKSHYPLKSADPTPLDQKLPLVQAIHRQCFNRSPLIAKVKATFHDSIKRIMVVTSQGIVAEDIIPRNYLHTTVVGQKNACRENSHWGMGGRHDLSFYSVELAKRIADEAVNRVVRQFDAVVPPAGEMPVVLGPGVTGILLHEAIGHGMEADFNRKKISTYSTMLGKKVAEPFVTIVDDGTIDDQSGSINFDDEGSPSQRTVLVEKGILTGYLHDKISAAHYSVPPTGNGRRESYAHYPLPRMRNTYMLSGPEIPEDVIRKAKNGIYVEDVANGEVRIGEGDFAFYVSKGRMIEGGKLTAPIKDVNIMGNGPKTLANIESVANDLALSQKGGGMCGKGHQWVPVSFGLPTCLVKSMTVGGLRKTGGLS